MLIRQRAAQNAALAHTADQNAFCAALWRAYSGCRARAHSRKPRDFTTHIRAQRHRDTETQQRSPAQETTVCAPYETTHLQGDDTRTDLRLGSRCAGEVSVVLVLVDDEARHHLDLGFKAVGGTAASVARLGGIALVIEEPSICTTRTPTCKRMHTSAQTSGPTYQRFVCRYIAVYNYHACPHTREIHRHALDIWATISHIQS